MKAARIGFIVAILCYALPWLASGFRIGGLRDSFTTGRISVSATNVLYGFDFLQHSPILVLSVIGLVIGLLSTWEVFGSRSGPIQRMACLLSSLCFVAGVCEQMWSGPGRGDLSTGVSETYGMARMMPGYTIGFLGVLLGTILSIKRTFFVRSDDLEISDEPPEAEPAASMLSDLNRRSSQPAGGRATRGVPPRPQASGASGPPNLPPSRAATEALAGTSNKPLFAQEAEPEPVRPGHAGWWLGGLAAVALLGLFLSKGGMFGGDRSGMELLDTMARAKRASWTAPEAPKSVVLDFLKDYNAGSFEKIYDSASKDFQKRIPLGHFLEDMRVRQTYLGKCDLSAQKEMEKLIAQHDTTLIFPLRLKFAKGEVVAFPTTFEYEKQSGQWKLSELTLDIPDELSPDKGRGMEGWTQRILEQWKAGDLQKIYAESSPEMRASLSFADFEKKLNGYQQEFGTCPFVSDKDEWRQSRGPVGMFRPRLLCAQKRVIAELRYVGHAGVWSLLSIGFPAPAPEHDVQTLIQGLTAAKGADRDNALLELEELGARAKDAVPALAKALKDPEPAIGARAAQVLGLMGADAGAAATALTQALDSRDEKLQRAAFEALVTIGPAAQQAVPLLLARLKKRGPANVYTLSVLARVDTATATPMLLDLVKDADPKVRATAADVLGFVDPVSEPVLSALAAALGDADPKVCKKAVASLSHIGAPAMPFLLEALKDQKPEVRATAADVLGDVRPVSEPVLSALAAGLRDTDPEVWKLTSRSLSRIGAPAVPVLLKALKDKKPEVRVGAAFALGKIGPDAKEAVPLLIQALKDGSIENADTALTGIGAAAVPPLIKLMSGPDRKLRAVAAAELTKFGPSAAAELATALRSRDPQVRALAVETFDYYEKAAVMFEDVVMVQPVIRPLADLLKDPARDLRWAAVRALRLLGAGATAALPDLIEALKDPDLQESVDHALEEIAPAAGAEAAATVVPTLTKLLKEPGMQIAAAKCLGYLKKRAKDALPALIQALEDPELEIRKSAADALGLIGQAVGAEAGPTVVPALGQALKDDALAVTVRDVYGLRAPPVEAALRRLWTDGVGTGPEADAAIPLLIQRLRGDIQRKDEFLARIHMRLLADLGPRAASAVPALQDIVKLPSSPELTRRAREALEKIAP